MSDWPLPFQRSAAAGLLESTDGLARLISIAKIRTSLAMPPDQRIWLDDDQQLTPSHQARQRDQDDPGRIVRTPWLHLALQEQRQLLSQGQVLGRQVRVRVQRE
jgi:hypothetical protein